MDRIRVSDQWTAAGSVADVQAVVAAFLRGRGMRVTGEQPGEVHARRAASRLGRVLGPLTPASWLPHQAVIKFRSRPAGVGVRAEVETAGGAAAGYPALFDRWMAELRRALPAPAGPV